MAKKEELAQLGHKVTKRLGDSAEQEVLEGFLSFARTPKRSVRVVGSREIATVVIVATSGRNPRQKGFVDLFLRVMRGVLGPEGENWHYNKQGKFFEFAKVDLTRIGGQP